MTSPKSATSPIQIGTEGVYRHKPFVVVGRIVYAWEDGAWNEWHLGFNDGSSGWLSDAQAEYAVTFLTKTDNPLPAPDQAGRGRRCMLNSTEYVLTAITRARYVGVQGELPFEYWDKDEYVFGDLRSGDGRFATIDYSESPPLVFTGEFVDFDSLRLTNLKQFEGWS